MTLEVKGEMKLGKNVTLECSVNLDPIIIDSIKLQNGIIGFYKKKLVYEIKELKLEHQNKNFTCIVTYFFGSYRNSLSKSVVLNLTDFTGILFF